MLRVFIEFENPNAISASRVVAPGATPTGNTGIKSATIGYRIKTKQITILQKARPSFNPPVKEPKGFELVQISNFTRNGTRKGVGAKYKVFELLQISNLAWNGTQYDPKCSLPVPMN
eukprot:scaffold4166_cov95-Cylindrotheca_fusiformis.AAC.6